MTTCDHCEQQAIYHDVRIINGVHSTVHLCHEHAIEAGINLGPIDLSIILEIPQHITELASGKSCPDCGMTIAMYKKASLLGCPTCYETFSKQLNHIIAKVQASHTQHVGRAPAQISMEADRHLKIRRLLKQLEAAVSQEEYEHAATLRDQLKDLHDTGYEDEI